MKISTKGLYGLHLMLDLLKEYETGFVSLRVAAARLDIPHKYLEQIAASLCRAQLLDSMRGPNGGYRLNKVPDDYQVGEVLRALEGDLLPTACLKNCPRRKQEALTSAEEVHHILPLAAGGTHEERNRMALCTSCHSEITAREGGRWG